LSYIIYNDFLRYIQETQLNQIISSNNSYLLLAENAAQEDFKEYLSQRYDLTQEFTDTMQYDPTAAYNAGDRVYLNAPAYDQTKTYALGVLTLSNGAVYACSVAITAPESFTPAHWTLLGNQYDMFYAITPYPVFNISKGWYNLGDIVFWKNHTYTALQKTVCLSHQQKIQYYRTGNVPYPNVFPDDPTNGPLWWKDNGAYVVPAGNLLTQNPATYIQITQQRNDIFLVGGNQLPVNGTVYNDTSLAGWTISIERRGFGTMQPGVDYNLILNSNNQTIGWQLIKPGDKFGNGEIFIEHFEPIISTQAPLNPFANLTSEQIITTYFIAGDNRNQKVLQHFISLSVYYLYYRLAPKTIPDTRVKAQKEAMVWLTLAMEGKIVPDLVSIQPPQGMRIRWGSNEKLINSY
jgi:hypothetical protein